MKPRFFKTQAELQDFMLEMTNLGRGGVFHLLIMHDDACSPRSCTCKPWYEVRDGTTDNILEGARLAEKWRKDTSS